MTPDASASSPYARALETLRTRTNYEQIDRRRGAFDLAPMRGLLERMGNPERDLKIVHVAGTKGKGSTTWFIDAFLRRMGLRTGRYISPHLQRIEERIAIGGAPLSQDRFGEAVLEASKHSEGGGATFFDVLTAAALRVFAEERVDFAVVETGLGGRLDSTNATPKIACALTSMGLEHTEVLGNTIEEIAKEKAHIARAGVPVFSVSDPASAAGMSIAAMVGEIGAPLFVMNREFRARNVRTEGSLSTIDVETLRCYYMDITIPSPAAFQVENAALAVAVVDDLAARGFTPDPRRALETPPDTHASDLAIPGRFELVNSSPPIVLDGAHTAESLAALLDSVGRVFPGRRLAVVFGVSRDKDVGRLLSTFRGRADAWIATHADSPRAMPAEDVARAVAQGGFVVKTAPDTGSALALARAETGAVVVVTGSLYLVAEARALLGLT